MKMFNQAAKAAAVIVPIALMGCEQTRDGRQKPVLEVSRTVTAWQCSNADVENIRRPIAQANLYDAYKTARESDGLEVKPIGEAITRASVTRELQDIQYDAIAFYNCPLNSQLQISATAGLFDNLSYMNNDRKSIIVHRIKFAMDHSFTEFENALLRGDRDAQVVPEAIDLLLPVLGVSKTIDGVEYASASLLRGGYDIYQEKFLGGKTTELLVRQMHKEREKTWEAISKDNGIDGRNLSETLIMLAQYQNAGSFFSALRGIEDAVENQNSG